MKNSKDYYKILGVSKDTDVATIKKAYRTLAMEHHPDTNKGDEKSEAKFKEIAEAYEVLSDPNKKRNYDSGGMRGGLGGNPFDIFNSVFGGGNPFGGVRTSARQVVGPDNKLVLRVSLAQIITGDTAIIEFTRFLACEECKGQGHIPTSEKCYSCNGFGQLSSQMANMSFVTTCPRCGGCGKAIEKCKKCSGEAYTSVKEKIKLEVPKGIMPHSMLKIPDKGNEIYYNESRVTGNTWVIIDYPRTENGVSLDLRNIYVSIRVPFNTVIAEEQIEVDVLGCKILKFKIDSAKSSGYQYKIQGEGVVAGKDAFVKVFIDSPKNKLSEEEKTKLNKVMGEIYGNPPKQFKTINN